MIIESQQEYYSRKLPGTDIHSLCKVPFSGFEIIIRLLQKKPVILVVSRPGSE